ncbi:MAG: response regulator transcription factor [Nitrospirota bacterium]|nr:response regulator transcription factor [Nitrospirota bacterium]MDP3597959.1 response regulator transcription factor [Nitrospirota bacterium]
MLAQAVKPIRLLLVDDHEVVRMGLEALFRRVRTVQVVGEANTVASAVTEAIRLRPDIVLLDLRLPDGSGIEACREILGTCPDTHVVFLTSFADEDAMLSTTFAGAKGYLLKTIGGTALVQAIHAIAGGQSILDPAVTESVLARMRSLSTMDANGQQAILSPQERRILPLLADGKTNKEIAVALGLSDKTIKNYLFNIFRKLQVTSRTQAATMFIKQQSS